MSFADFGRSLDHRASVGSRPAVSDSVSTTFADRRRWHEGVQAPPGRRLPGQDRERREAGQQGDGHEDGAEGDHEFNGH